MEDNTKFVEFERYCYRCAHYDEDEADPKSKCYGCLDEPVNIDSHKPVNFKERDILAEKKK